MRNFSLEKYNPSEKVYGVGIYYPGKYKSREGAKKTKSYSIWVSMLQRCYDKKLHERHPSYAECKVVDEWLIFQNFAKWFDENYIEGYQLDKDLMIPGNKIYSPETCRFVPKELNLAIIKPFENRELPTGVYKHHKRFVVHVKSENKCVYVGCYKTQTEAIEAYKTSKKKELVKLAQKYKNQIASDLYKLLINYEVCQS